MTGGGVVQVGQKRAPQGLFYRNFTPPLLLWRLNRTKFSSNGEHFFDVAKFCKKFSAIFSWNFHDFFGKKTLHRAVFFQWFFGPFERPFFSDFFGHFLGHFFENFLKIFSEIFLSSKHEQRPILPSTRDVTTMSYSSATWAHRAQLSEQLHVRERTVEIVTTGNP